MPNLSAKLVKWKVKLGSKVGQGSTLAIYEALGGKGSSRLRAVGVGTVNKLLVEEGDMVSEGQAVLSLEGCSHPIVMKDMCAECGADLRQAADRGQKNVTTDASIRMVHNIPELIVSEKQAKELGKADEERLLKARKLVLLVDLDQTLIHTTNDNVAPNLKDVKHFQLWHGNSLLWYHTKFRPHTEEFLERISKMFELHICTFGVRAYAHTIVKFLDPDGKYFSHRILSRDECFSSNSKTANLGSLFPCGDSMVCIIDDREDVWNFAPNLVHVKPYKVFQGTADINAPPGTKGEINDNDPCPEPTSSHIQTIDTKAESKTDESKMDVDINDKGNDNEENEDKENSDKANDNEENEDKEKRGNSDNEERNTEDKENSDKANDNEERNAEGNEKSENSSHEDKDKIQMDNKNDENNEVIASKKENRTDSSQENGTTEPKVMNDNELLHDVSKETGSKEENIIIDKSIDESKDDTKLGKEKKNEDGTCTKDVEERMESEPKPTENEKEADKKSEKSEKENLIELEDNDDHIKFLEDKLTTVYKAYYDEYDALESKTKENMPDLNQIMPRIRGHVLKGCNILFSGVFPTNFPPEKSRAFTAAKALGAKIHQNFISRKDPRTNERTTHVIAAKLGTAKVNQAQKQGGVKIVTPDWLWCCEERWEKADERLFQLTRDIPLPYARDSPDVMRQSKHKRKAGDSCQNVNPSKQPKIDSDMREQTAGMSIDPEESSSSSMASMENSTNSVKNSPGSRLKRNFSDDINPLYSFSTQQLSDMDKEVEDIFDESDSDGSDNSNQEISEKVRQKVLSGESDSDSSGESLSGEFPRGWKHKQHNKRKRKDTEESLASDMKLAEGQSEGSVASDDSDDYNESIGSVDEEIASAVEREFLS